MNFVKSMSVGQIVYVLSNKAQAVLPALVVEEHRTRHMSGEEVRWTIQYGPPGQQKTVDSNKLNGELYASLSEVEEAMQARFQEFIASLIGKASSLEQKWYPDLHRQVTASVFEADKLDPESLLEEIDNQPPGALMSVSQNAPVQHMTTQGLQSARDRLKQQMLDEEVEEAHL